MYIEKEVIFYAQYPFGNIPITMNTISIAEERGKYVSWVTIGDEDVTEAHYTMEKALESYVDKTLEEFDDEIEEVRTYFDNASYWKMEYKEFVYDYLKELEREEK